MTKQSCFIPGLTSRFGFFQSAFGMGIGMFQIIDILVTHIITAIDKPNGYRLFISLNVNQTNFTLVRWVVHDSMPSSVENWFQESGRAGRDGCLAYCIVCEYSLVSTHFTFINYLNRLSDSGLL